MTFEEKMDRLTERQEALAQTVELLSLQTRDFEARTDILLQDHEKSLKQLQTLSDRLVAILDRLSTIVVDHQETFRVTING